MCCNAADICTMLGDDGPGRELCKHSPEYCCKACMDSYGQKHEWKKNQLLSLLEGSCRNRLFSSYSDSYSYSFRQKFHSIYTFQLSINVFTANTCVLVIWKGRSISNVYLLINVYDDKCLLNSQEMGTQRTTPLLDFAHEKVYFNLHSIAAISLIRQPEK